MSIIFFVLFFSCVFLLPPVVTVAAMYVSWKRMGRSNRLADFAGRDGRMIVQNRLGWLRSGELDFLDGSHLLKIARRKSVFGIPCLQIRLNVRACNVTDMGFALVSGDWRQGVEVVNDVEARPVGDPAFDAIFSVYSTDIEETARLLSERCRIVLRQLHELFHSYGVFVWMDKDWLTIEKEDVFENERRMEQFYRLAVAVFDCFLENMGAPLISGAAQGSAGIKFLPPSEDDLSQPPLCRVCGTEVGAEGVQCKSCSTPHHRDCWQYCGGCSVYGCSCKTSIPLVRNFRRRKKNQG